METQQLPKGTIDSTVRALQRAVHDDASFKYIEEQVEKQDPTEILLRSMVEAVNQSTSLEEAPIRVMANASAKFHAQRA